MGKSVRPPKKLTEKDTEILFDLYRLRVLTIGQIKNLYFTNSKRYVYRRLGILREGGYIKSRPLVGRRGNKKAGCMYITDKGIQSLCEEGWLLNEPRVREAKENHVPSYALDYYVKVSGVYVHFKDTEWQYIENREVIRRYNLNRSSAITGMLLHPDGREIGIYLTGPNPDDQTLSKMLNEIHFNSAKIRRVVILCQNENTFGDIFRRCEYFHESGDIPVTVDSLMVMHYHHLDRLKQILNNNIIKKLIKHYLSSIAGKGMENIDRYRRMAEWSIQGKERERYHYVTHLLEHDIAKTLALLRYGKDHHTRNDYKDVYLLVNSHHVRMYQEKFRLYPHIKIISVNLEHDLREGVTDKS